MSPDPRKLSHNFPPALSRWLFGFLCLIVAAGIFSPSHSARAAVSLVQGNIQELGNRTVSVTSSVTYVGDLLVVAVQWDTAANLSSISDTQANAFTSAIGPIDAVGTRRFQLFYAKNIHGGANAVTVKLTATPSTALSVNVLEYSGADTTSPLDATSVGTGTGTAMDSGSVSTSSGNALIFGYGAVEAADITAAGSGFTPRMPLGDNAAAGHCGCGTSTEDKNVTPSGLYNATETNNGSSRSWIMMMATFKSVANGIQVSYRSDTLSDSRPSLTHFTWIEDRKCGLIFKCRGAAIPELRLVIDCIQDSRSIALAYSTVHTHGCRSSVRKSAVRIMAGGTGNRSVYRQTWIEEQFLAESDFLR